MRYFSVKTLDYLTNERKRLTRQKSKITHFLINNVCNIGILSESTKPEKNGGVAGTLAVLSSENVVEV